jgi:YD repeat-containing protein
MSPRTSSSSLLLPLCLLAACADPPGLHESACPSCALDDSQVEDLAGRERVMYGLGTGACALAFDQGSDGTIDERLSIDESTPGVIVVRGDGESRFAEYDERGQLTRFSSDGIDYVWHYDSEGHLKSFDADGITGSFAPLHREWSYFRDGRVISDIQYAPGTHIDERRTLLPDLDGRPTREDIDLRDRSGDFDRVPEATLRRSFGPNGVVEQRLERRDGPDDVTTYLYDQDGRSLGATTDRGADGSIDERVDKTLDAHGRVLTRSYRRGQDQLTITYQYDCEG